MLRARGTEHEVTVDLDHHCNLVWLRCETTSQGHFGDSQPVSQGEDYGLPEALPSHLWIFGSVRPSTDPLFVRASG